MEPGDGISPATKGGPSSDSRFIAVFNERPPSQCSLEVALRNIGLSIDHDDRRPRPPGRPPVPRFRTLACRHKPHNGRRGVDTIVATVLVVAVTLAASLAVSGFVFGVTGHAQNSAQIGVTGSALLATDFTSASATTTFTCASSSPGSYVAITNTGTVGSSVTTVSITWAGTNTAYVLSGACDIGATGSATASTYINFPPTTLITPSAIPGQTYTGTVTISNGARLIFTGTWQ
jgi:hypothetical protein